MINLVVSVGSYGQIFSRVEADFSLKEKRIDGSKSLTMGSVYFDKNVGQIVFDIKFPESFVVVINDSLMLKIKDHQVVDRKLAQGIVYFSIFNLSLNGNLPYFGLKDSPYELTNIEKENDMVISTWDFPELKNKGKMMLSQKNKKLFGVVSFAGQDTVISKQFFENYINIDGVDFPQRVVQFMYLAGEEDIKITNYKNVIINNEENEEFYNYPVPYFE